MIVFGVPGDGRPRGGAAAIDVQAAWLGPETASIRPMGAPPVAASPSARSQEDRDETIGPRLCRRPPAWHPRAGRVLERRWRSPSSVVGLGRSTGLNLKR